MRILVQLSSKSMSNVKSPRIEFVLNRGVMSMFNMFDSTVPQKIGGLNIKLCSIYLVSKDAKLLEKYHDF